LDGEKKRERQATKGCHEKRKTRLLARKKKRGARLPSGERKGEDVKRLPLGGGGRVPFSTTNFPYKWRGEKKIINKKGKKPG